MAPIEARLSAGSADLNATEGDRVDRIKSAEKLCKRRWPYVARALTATVVTIKIARSLPASPIVGTHRGRHL